jgi:hypothetical protein
MDQSAVTPDSMYCRRCGARIKVDSVFCSKCGTPVQSAIPPQQTAPMQQTLPIQQAISMPQATPAYVLPEERRQSGLGVASFAIAIFSLVYFLVVFVGAGVISYNGSYSSAYSFVVILGLLIILGGIVLLIGLGLGIGAVAQKNRKKVFAVIGLVLNALMILALAVLETIGQLRT